MEFLSTVSLLLAIFLFFFLSGYGVTSIVFVNGLRSYRFIACPIVGYVIWIYLTHIISGNFSASVGNSSIIAAIVVILSSIFYYFRLETHNSHHDMASECKLILLLLAPISVVILWPLFYIGATTYQASVNPDFFLGLTDNHWLMEHPTNIFNHTAEKTGDTIENTYAPFNESTGFISASARYRGAFVAILLERILGVDQRTGLAITLGFFHLLMPLAQYCFCRIVLRLDKTAAIICVFFLGISSSLSLGYISYYIGQTSVMAFFPFLLTLGYLCFTEKGINIYLLTAFCAGSAFVCYTGLCVYAAAPFIPFSLYVLIFRKITFLRLISLVLGFLAFLLATHVKMLAMIYDQILAWKNVSMNLANFGFLGQYYLDFVTERFFPMFLGLTTYTMESSILDLWLGREVHQITMLTLSAVLLIALIYAIYKWIKATQDHLSRAMGASCFLVYGFFILYYIFVSPYGYGSFKNSMWLQFMLMVPFAHLFQESIRRIRHGNKTHRINRTIIYLFIFTPFLLGNLIGSIEYGYKGLGQDTKNGYMVIVHNFSGNYRYLSLADNIRNYIKKTDSIGLAFINSAQQEWVSYYLRDFKVSYLGQWALPGDDENLPDRITRQVKDPYGNTTLFSPTYFHGASDNFILLPQANTFNSDIIDNELGKPLWENDTFRFFKAQDAPDFMFPGQGFYRAEYRSSKDYFIPKPARWTAEGAEIFLINPSSSEKPYQITLTGFAGFGYSSAERTIDFFINGEKIGRSKKINGFGRITSDSFLPKEKVNIVRFEIQEKVTTTKRNIRLWAKDVPLDYRKLNLWVSNIQLQKPDTKIEPLPLEVPIMGHELFLKSTAFNGIEPNYWIRDDFSISLPKSNATRFVKINFFIPGDLELPLTIKTVIEHTQADLQFFSHGEASMQLKIPEETIQQNIVNIRLTPEKCFVPKNYDQKRRPVIQSLRLNSIQLNS